MLAKKALAGTAGAPKLYVEDVMSSYLYTGTGANLTITNNIDLSTEGGLVWIKNRSLQDSGSTRSHWLFDSARTAGYSLSTNSTSAESNVFSGSIPFSTTGFSINTSDANLNGTGSSAYTYVSWTFRKAKKFFDIVTYTGNGSNRTISHNLGSVPGSIFIKRTDTTGAWAVYHRSLANTEYLVLNTTAAKATGTTYWNSTTPTSTEFSLGTATDVNANTGTYVAYLFAHDAGGFGDAGSDSIIKCGSFTCDGSGNAEVDLGWEPQWLLRKRSDGAVDWVITDNMRGWTNGGNDAFLYPNLSDAEASANRGHCTATGFTVTNQTASSVHIYIAIRRGPMKTPTSGTSVFAIDTLDGTTLPAFVSGFPVDMAIQRYNINTVDDPQVATRLLQATQLLTSSTAVESSASLKTFDFNNGYDSRTGTSSNWYSWMFRRAPGFFDVVCYTGTGSNRTVSHNLGVVPELIIVKNRGVGENWAVYNSSDGNTKWMQLNTTNASAAASTIWNNTSPTSSVFSVGTSSSVNGSSETYVAYLFASLSGVSKVGSYTGNGSSQTINCNFTAGSRFIMIKRTDSTGDWKVIDTARGIVSGNDPTLALNSTAAEVTGTDCIDPDNSGFIVNQETTNNLNVNNATYIYLSVA